MDHLQELLNLRLLDFVTLHKIKLNKFLRAIDTKEKKEMAKNINYLPHICRVKDILDFLPSKWRFNFVIEARFLRDYMLKSNISYHVFKERFLKNLGFIIVEKFIVRNLYIDEIAIHKGRFFGGHFLLYDRFHNITIAVPDVIKLKTNWLKNNILRKTAFSLVVSDVHNYIFYTTPNSFKRTYRTVFFASTSKDILPNKKYHVIRPLYSYKESGKRYLPKYFPTIKKTGKDNEYLLKLQQDIVSVLFNTGKISREMYTWLRSIYEGKRPLFYTLYNHMIYKTLFCYSVIERAAPSKTLKNITENIDPIILEKSIEHVNEHYQLTVRLDQINAASVIIDSYLKTQNTLVFAEVGSGKTILAFLVCTYLLIHNHNIKILYLVPTRILHNQVNTLKEKSPILSNINVSTIKRSYEEKDNIKFDFGIIDEEQKFGLISKEYLANVTLKLTATPQPLSLIDKTKQKIVSLKKPERNIITQSFDMIESDRIKNILISALYKERVIINIYSSIKGMAVLHQRLKHYLSDFPEPYEIINLHGQLTSKQQNEILNIIKTKSKYLLLVATTVFEVGIDIPFLNTMIIWDSKSFGLSQLHQLRGRIGRLGQESYCWLETCSVSKPKAKKRIDFFVKFGNGAKLSYIDLILRGAGDVAKRTTKKTKQHGAPHPCFSFVAVFLLDQLNETFYNRYRDFMPYFMQVERT